MATLSAYKLGAINPVELSDWFYASDPIYSYVVSCSVCEGKYKSVYFKITAVDIDNQLFMEIIYSKIYYD